MCTIHSRCQRSPFAIVPRHPKWVIVVFLYHCYDRGTFLWNQPIVREKPTFPLIWYPIQDRMVLLKNCGQKTFWDFNPIIRFHQVYRQ